jgi:phenylpropionate dioxygenase-like ring-hydroxylating dioxygenase large terminal subunit
MELASSGPSSSAAADEPARSPGPSVQDYLDTDSREVPEILRYDVNDPLGSEDVSVDRYISKSWHDDEVEKVWRRAWQFACRLDQIPNVGDHVLYEIAGDSLIVMRSGPDEVKALFNACLHRGRKLRGQAGSVSELRCPFHSFAWNLDGSLKDIPCQWDFSHIKPESFSLPEANVGIWEGFVFVNLDQGCEPFGDFIATLAAETERWPMADRTIYFHIAAEIACNWKVALEAFIESFHVIGTHPQLMPWMADANSQYDVKAREPWSRTITVQGVPSPHVAAGMTEEDVLESYYETRAFYSAADGRDLTVSEDTDLTIPEGGTARSVLANQLRNQLENTFGRSYADATDTELLDSIQYSLFPNFCVFVGERTNAVYRFRPAGHDPDRCIAEVMLLAPPPGPGQERPAPAPVRWLAEGEQFADVTELGLLGPVFDQDYFNLPYIQEGLHTTRKPGITLANYQESRIRHFHHLLEKWLSR